MLTCVGRFLAVDVWRNDLGAVSSVVQSSSESYTTHGSMLVAVMQYGSACFFSFSWLKSDGCLFFFGLRSTS